MNEKNEQYSKTKERLLENISNIIKGKRKQKYLTQIELADELGISYQLLQRYEYGKSLPPVYMLPAICDALGFELSDLFDISVRLNESIGSQKDNKESRNNADIQVIISEYKRIKRKLNGNQLSDVVLNLVNKTKKEREIILKLIK